LPTFLQDAASHGLSPAAAAHGALLFKACNGTAFPASGAFAGPGRRADVVGAGSAVFQVVWVSEDGTRLKAQAPNDGTFNLGPSRIKVVVPGGGVSAVTYRSVELAGSDAHGPAGLLFTAASAGRPFPPDAWRVAPVSTPTLNPHPKPTLHPPSTPHPTPHTHNPTLSTPSITHPHPTPSTPHSLHLQPHTLHPKPHTLHPQPQTFYTFNHTPYILNPKP